MIKLIRVKKAAEAAGVSVQTIYRWVDTEPDFPPLIKLSPGATAIEESLFVQFIESRTQRKQAAPQGVPA